MKAWLYECRVTHERLLPVRRRFTYATAYLCVEPGAPGADRRPRLFSLNAPNVVSVRERDYLPTGEPLHNPGGSPAPAGPAAATLTGRVGALCAAGGCDPGPGSRTLLVTMPRVLGYGYNPVSFHFCLRSDGTAVAAIAEVTNTYREVKPYLVPAVPGTRGRFRASRIKDFYVSPFSPPDLAFDFDLQLPGDTLDVRIATHGPDGPVVRTALGGRRRELTDKALASFLVRHPLLPLAVMARIHWQAARLWWRRVPHFRKSDRPAHQRNLYRPHPSIRVGPSP
jgi:uncharacterized protein